MALILIRKLGTRLGSTGRKESWGEFLCFNFGCCKIVERCLGSGKRYKSCGCMKSILLSRMGKLREYSNERNKKISDSKKGQKRKPFTEEHLRNIGKAQKGRKHTLETRRKMRIAKQGKVTSEETRKKQSETKKDKFKKGERIIWNKGLTAKEDSRILFGESHPQWQNGKSFEIYPKKFKQIKKFILERDNYQCQYPGCIEIHDRLHVHHIDYDKQNNNPENLITLGTSCHSKTVGKSKRVYFTEFYQNIIINKLMECLL